MIINRSKRTDFNDILEVILDEGMIIDESHVKHSEMCIVKVFTFTEDLCDEFPDLIGKSFSVEYFWDPSWGIVNQIDTIQEVEKVEVVAYEWVPKED